jgi:chitinase
MYRPIAHSALAPLLAAALAACATTGERGDGARARAFADGAAPAAAGDASVQPNADGGGGTAPGDSAVGTSPPRPPSDAATDGRAAVDGRASDASGGQGGEAGAATGQWVLGYYAPYQRDLLAPSEIDWSGISHLVVTRLKTDGSGRVQRDLDVDPTNGPILARELSMRAHQNGRKAMLLLGGAGAGTTIRGSSSSGNRAAFVQALLQAMLDLGYDGLDLDWEDDVDYDLFIALARDLRASPLAPPGLILTVGGFSINGNFQKVDPKVPMLAQHLDRYSLMTYYPGTALAGGGWLSWHNCPLTGLKNTTPVTIEDSLARHVTAGIPRAKLAMGVAFYAICYTGSVTQPNQSTENGVQIRGGDNDFPFTKLFANGGPFNAAYRQWDATAQAPYLSLPTAESHGCRYISFDDEQSLEAKGAFSRKNGYGGIIVWTINQGHLKNSTKPVNALTQALKRGFLDP